MGAFETFCGGSKEEKQARSGATEVGVWEDVEVA